MIVVDPSLLWYLDLKIDFFSSFTYFANPIIERGYAESNLLSAIFLTVRKQRNRKKLKKYKPSVKDLRRGMIS